MAFLAIVALLASAVATYAIGAAFIAPQGSFLRTKGGIGLLIMFGLSFVFLPPQLTMLDSLTSSLGQLPGMEWPANYNKIVYDVIWVATSVAGLLAGMQIWKAGKPGWREGSNLSDASAASRVSSMLPLADSLPAALEVLGQAHLTQKDLLRVANDVRTIGWRMGDSLPPSDGAVYTMVAAKVAAPGAAAVTGYLLEGAGRRGPR